MSEVKYDEGEILHDDCQGDCDNDGLIIDVLGQGIEPYEDRNCNRSWDFEPEEILEANNADYSSAQKKGTLRP